MPMEYRRLTGREEAELRALAAHRDSLYSSRRKLAFDRRGSSGNGGRKEPYKESHPPSSQSQTQAIYGLHSIGQRERAVRPKVE
jgi:hypothetical protein